MEKTLYLGLEIPPDLQAESIVHCPFIRIVPKPFDDPAMISAFRNFHSFTHLIFTSRSAVSIFFDLVQSFQINETEIIDKTIISVGKRTAEKLKKYGIESDLIAGEETAEGILEILQLLDLKMSYFFLPQSSIARPVISEWLAKRQIAHLACSIYDTLPNLPEPLPDLNQFDRIIFTSPSVVSAFIQGYHSLPNDKILTCIGPVTESHLQKLWGLQCS
jgi:uroporphyrinogen-III synthase